MIEVEYFGPLNITIKPFSNKGFNNAAVYVNGTLYSCGGTAGPACYRYDLESNSSSWESFTTIPGNAENNPAVAFQQFFWYFNDKIRQVPVKGGNITSYDWGLGYHGCAVGNGSHTVMIQYLNRSVLMNSDPSTPTNWTTVVELNTAVYWCGCLWLGNIIYVTGGLEASGGQIDTTQLFNTDTFDLKLGAPLPKSIYYHRMGVIDGKPAVIGGFNGFGFGLSYLSSIYVYDYCTNTWSLSDRSLKTATSRFGSIIF